ncbi:SGNH/GDSL hydrolase family protein [Thorsellia anophelis]|uniref:Lysophospholipase L1 n=1 Tax=Thorsellia anophelis DSM 18579 TaxID=1123402 RepID=A0A1I0BLY4_9GAMM|nr:SGNH/GDSL hydrolase family protein [Thorsellia anophelis]SET07284.1 Lysophospholipase L1 [Thorsellia anophelis DSM 18579]
MGLNTVKACMKYLMKSKIKIMIAFILTILLLGCQETLTSNESEYGKNQNNSSINQAGNLYNFNINSTVQLQNHFLNANNHRVHILQLGDSHTAADVFTGKVRTILQTKYGDGGIGFIPAADIKGIRSNLVTIETNNSKWEILTSRKEQSSIFPLGGYQVNTQNQSGNIQIKPRKNYVSKINKYEMSILYHSSTDNTIIVNRNKLTIDGKSRNWAWSPFVSNLSLPIQLDVNQSKNLSIGGIFLASEKQNGVVLSTLGINGATAMFWDKWHTSWYNSLKEISPQMVILAYGTNEAYDATLDLNQYKIDLNARIQKLKSLLPNTAFLLIGPPDSMKIKGPMASTQCHSQYANHLAAIIEIQKQVAKKNQIMFWDWQAAMGGPCSIQKWVSKQLAKDDMVHLTAEGYEMSAKSFSADLIKLLGAGQ